MLPWTCYGSNISILVHHQIIECFTSRWWIEWRLSQQKLLEPHYSIVVEAPIDPGTTSMWRLIDVCIIWDSRAQVLVKNSGRLQDFWFLNCHSSTQDLIALSIYSVLHVPLYSYPKTILVVSYLFFVIFHFETVLNDNWSVKWCSSTEHIILLTWS